MDGLESIPYIGEYTLTESAVCTDAGGVVRRAFIANDSSSPAFLAKLYRKSVLAEQALLRERLQHDIHAGRLRGHPGVAALVEVVETDDVLCLIIEDIRGVNILDYVSRMGPFSEHQARVLFRQILCASAYCVRAGIGHRVSIENAVIVPSADAESLHFRFADTCSNTGLHVTAMTCTLAPEAVVNLSTSVSDSSVAYMCGIFLYVLVVGSVPFHSHSREILLEKVAHEPVPLTRGMSVALRSVLAELLEKNPRFRRSLEEVSQGQWVNCRILDYDDDSFFSGELSSLPTTYHGDLDDPWFSSLEDSACGAKEEHRQGFLPLRQFRAHENPRSSATVAMTQVGIGRWLSEAGNCRKTLIESSGDISYGARPERVPKTRTPMPGLMHARPSDGAGLNALSCASDQLRGDWESGLFTPGRAAGFRGTLQGAEDRDVFIACGDLGRQWAPREEHLWEDVAAKNEPASRLSLHRSSSSDSQMHRGFASGPAVAGQVQKSVRTGALSAFLPTETLLRREHDQESLPGFLSKAQDVSAAARPSAMVLQRNSLPAAASNHDGMGSQTEPRNPVRRSEQRRVFQRSTSRLETMDPRQTAPVGTEDLPGSLLAYDDITRWENTYITPKRQPPVRSSAKHNESADSRELSLEKLQQAAMPATAMPGSRTTSTPRVTERNCVPFRAWTRAWRIRKQRSRSRRTRSESMPWFDTHPGSPT